MIRPRLVLVAWMTFIALAMMSIGCSSNRAAPSVNTSDAPIDLADVDPARLQLVAHGSRDELTFRAPAPGVIYVYNASQRQYLLQHFPLNKGQTFTLPPDSGRGRINKESVELEHDTNARDEYQIWFAPQS